MSRQQQAQQRESPETAGRRTFLSAFLAIVCGGLATVAPVGAGLWAFLDPLRRKAAASSFLPVTELSSLPDDGVPRQFPVVADRVDAWTGFVPQAPSIVAYSRRRLACTFGFSIQPRSRAGSIRSLSPRTSA